MTICTDSEKWKIKYCCSIRFVLLYGCWKEYILLAVLQNLRSEKAKLKITKRHRGHDLKSILMFDLIFNACRQGGSQLSFFDIDT